MGGWLSQQHYRIASTQKSQLRMQLAPLLVYHHLRVCLRNSLIAMLVAVQDHPGNARHDEARRHNRLARLPPRGLKKRFAIFGPSSRCLVVVQFVVVYDPCYGVRSKAACRLLMTPLAGIFLPPKTPWPCGCQEMSKCKVQRPKQPPIPKRRRRCSVLSFANPSQCCEKLATRAPTSGDPFLQITNSFFLVPSSP